MSLILSIENVDRLPDGGPVRVEVNARGLDIGRDQHLDWTLPDPSRIISGKHCEVRYSDGGYWLHDVSSNGTFINGAEFRVEGPHRLHDGDRLVIGHYIIAAKLVSDQASAEPMVAPKVATQTDDPWGGGGDVAPPVDRRELMPLASAPNSPDFLDWASSVGTPRPVEPAEPPRRGAEARQSGPEDDALWLRAPVAPLPVVEAPPPIPVPRRPAPQPDADLGLQVAGSAMRPQQEPPRYDAPPPATADPDAMTLKRIAHAAGLSEATFAGRDPGKVADEIGGTLRLVAENLAQMLASRAETKSLIRSSSRTMIRAAENNPLKFAPTPEEALRIMFGPANTNYLDARATIASSFADLKAHQMHTYAAMQSALEALFQDLAPAEIDKSVETERGLSAMVGSRKGKLWDAYVERWRSKTMRSDGRLVEAFMLLFADAYDRLQGRPR